MELHAVIGFGLPRFDFYLFFIILGEGSCMKFVKGLILMKFRIRFTIFSGGFFDFFGYY